jgi:AcrR family transcriptional regulator
MRERISPQLETRRAKEALYRQRILDSAERVFSEQSYDDAGIQDIAHGAGIALGTLYTVMEGKWEIYCAVHERRMAEMFGALEGALGVSTDGKEALLNGAEAIVRWFAEQPNYLRIHLQQGLDWATATGLASEEQLEAWSRGLELARQQIDRAKREGTFVDMDTQVAAMMMAATYRVYLQAWLEQDGAQSIDTLVESLGAQLRRSFFRSRRASSRS